MLHAQIVGLGGVGLTPAWLTLRGFQQLLVFRVPLLQTGLKEVLEKLGRPDGSGGSGVLTYTDKAWRSFKKKLKQKLSMWVR